MSCGLGQLIPYFECQYPQVVADNSVVVNSGGTPASGMGDYVDPFSFPIPQYLTPGNNRGLNCACGGSCCGGMADFTAPGGLFTGDFSEWGIAEWGIIATGVYVLFSLRGDVKRHGRKAKSAAKSATKAYRNER